MKRTKGLAAAACLFCLAGYRASSQGGELAPVISKVASRPVELPGELMAFQAVSVHARVAGYVDRVLVDRGTVVKQGDLLVELTAPEMTAQLAESESKFQAAQGERAQAEAQLAAVESTYDRMKKAAETPGAIAGNELVLSEKRVEAARAQLATRQQAIQAAESAVRALRDLQGYLRITAPFAGVVTERVVHPGALVGPGKDAPLLTIQQVSELRLVVQLPEEHVGGIVSGATVSFHVPAWPERTFSGTLSRVSHTVDVKTRTMPVEIDVMNRDGSLAPGMYATVRWPVRRARPSLFVPKTSVVTTTERTFVIRNQAGHAEWVDVRKGAADGDLVEVMGNLNAGDKVVRRATDEIREGTTISGRVAH